MVDVQLSYYILVIFFGGDKGSWVIEDVLILHHFCCVSLTYETIEGEWRGVASWLTYESFKPDLFFFSSVRNYCPRKLVKG